MIIDIEIKHSSANESIKRLIISCLTSLSYIDYIIINKYLTEENIEKITKFITFDSISNSVPDIIINSLKFLINFYIKSFDLGIYDHFKIFLEEKGETIKSIFWLFIESTEQENYSLTEENSYIAFLTSCFFITISLKSKVWEKTYEKNILKACSESIKKFIYETFSSKNFPTGNIPSEISNQSQKDEEMLKEEYEKSKENLKNRFSLIRLLGKILGFISKENVYKKIYHIEYFKYIFYFVPDLFHIDFTDINSNVYNILNICTYFNECKILFYLEKEKNFKILRNDLFTRIIHTLSNYKSLKETFSRNEEIKKNSKSKKEEIENEEVKTAVDEKLKLFDNINNKNKIFATSNFNDFTMLMSVLCNLLIMNDFYVFKNILFEEFDFDLDNFKRNLAEFIEDFEKKEKMKSRIVNFERSVHPAKLFLMIIDPLVKFTSLIIYNYFFNSF